MQPPLIFNVVSAEHPPALPLKGKKMTKALQAEYEKKCLERGLKPTNLARARKTFSTYDHIGGYTTGENMPATDAHDTQTSQKEEMVLVKKSLLREIIEELKKFKNVKQVETREELEKALS
jgi:hypothetical protein